MTERSSIKIVHFLEKVREEDPSWFNLLLSTAEHLEASTPSQQPSGGGVTASASQVSAPLSQTAATGATGSSDKVQAGGSPVTAAHDVICLTGPDNAGTGQKTADAAANTSDPGRDSSSGSSNRLRLRQTATGKAWGSASVRSRTES